jgi:hypothetical protein
MPEFVEVNAFRETIRILEDQIKAMAPGSVIVAGFEPLITAGAAGQVWTGNKTWQQPRLADANLSNFLNIVWNEDQAADQSLNLITGAANRTITLIGDPTLSDWFDQGVKVASSPKFKELTLGPNDAAPETKLIYKAFFDSPTNALELTAGWVVGKGSGAPTSGSPDVPTVRGTEWDLDTHQFINPLGFAPDPSGCHIGGLLLFSDTSDGKIKGFKTSDGSLDGQTAAHGLVNVKGICADGTHFYICGFENGVGAHINKYLLSSYALISTWSPPFPTVMFPIGLQIAGGVLYMGDSGLKKMFTVNASTMIGTGTSIDWPEFSPGNKWILSFFVINGAGTTIWSGADNGTEKHLLKMDASTLAVQVDGGWKPQAETFYGMQPALREENGQQRLYGGYGNSACKVDPATCLKYYSIAKVGHTLACVRQDGTYLYAVYSDPATGIDRLLMNPLGNPSTEDGILEFWVNRLGTMTKAAWYDAADLSLSIEGPIYSLITTGTAPFQPASATMCPNLNADLLDGVHASSLAPSTAKYILQQPATGLSDAQALSALATGILKSTTGTGVLSIATGGDLPSHSHAMALDDLSDVAAGAPSDGDVLTWVAARSDWEPAPPSPGGSGGGGGAFTDLTDAPGTYAAGDAGKFVRVKATYDGLEFAAVSGGAVADDDVAFLDDFVGTSFDWMWRTFGTGSGKTIALPGDKVSIAVSEGTNADSGSGNQVGFYTGCAAEPSEYIAKFSNIILGKNGSIILFVLTDPAAIPGPNQGVVYYYYGDGTGTHLFYTLNPGVVGYGGTATSTASTIYLKIRMLGGPLKNQFTFYWSTDGAAWTQAEQSAGVPMVFSNLAGNTQQPFWAGVLLQNWSDGGSYHAVSCDVEWFKMTRPRGIRA